MGKVCYQLGYPSSPHTSSDCTTAACIQVTVDPSMLEAVVRDHLNTSARRTMVVTQPIKVTVVGQGGARQTIRYRSKCMIFGNSCFDNIPDDCKPLRAHFLQGA